jgi:ABC-type Fe3+-hydroxamate transport system substrate-binding protein
MRSSADDLGTVNELPARPARIVSLVPNLSEVLWWWHLSPQVVGVTDYCVAPPRAFDHAARVRGTKNPDTAAIVDLEPDLVVASEEENRELDVTRLRDAGVRVHVTKVRTVADARASLERLGEAVGVPAAGVGLSQSIVRALDQLRRPGRTLTTATPIWRDAPQRGGDDERWWLIGRDTFAGDLLATCGFAVLPDDDDGRYPTLTLGELAERDPEVVLMPDEPYAFGTADAEVFDRWRARVRRLDGTQLSWWGPRTPHALGDLARTARQLAAPRRHAA